MASRVIFVLAALCLTVCYADIACVSQHIELTDDNILMSSFDKNYQTGDIHYRNCSTVPVPQSRQYVGWYPDPSSTEHRLQVNLPRVMAITGIVFQKTWAQCPDGHHDIATDGFMQTFDVKYVTPGDASKVLVTFAENMISLMANTYEHEVKFDKPITTSRLVIDPKLSSPYPCFRFKLMGCRPDHMCPSNWCINGGECTGVNSCTCPLGFFGARCNETVLNLETQDYSFTEIKDNQLMTPAAVFDIVGDGVTVLEDAFFDADARKRSGHNHNHHQHSCQFSCNSCHLHYNHHNNQHNNHNNQNNNHNGGGQNNHCMHNLHNNHQGFTTHMNVHFGNGHHGHTYLYSNGGHLPGHNGACLSYNDGHLNFQVSTNTHSWLARFAINLGQNLWHAIATSWHPQQGVTISLNNQVVASSNQRTPCNSCSNQTPLLIGSGQSTSASVNHNVTLNMTINNLLMYNTTLTSLQNIGFSGTFTPPPPTTTPAPTTTPPPTKSTQSTTTTTAITTTTTAATTTSGPHRPVCFSYVQEPRIGANNKTTRCQVGEVCVLYEEQNLYTAKCLEQQLCVSGARLASTHCWTCCDSYLCNDHCSASTTNTCKDESGCNMLSRTGFDVCGDSVIAVNLCRKTCGHCT